MKKKRYLVFDTSKRKFAIAALVKKEWKPEEEYMESGGDVFWYRVDFYDGTKPITNRGDSLFFLAEIEGQFQNPAEALTAYLPDVMSFVLKQISSINSSLHPRYT